jgi:hypothetical protein
VLFETILLKPQQVKRQGIRGMLAHDIADGRKQSKRWKLVCTACWEGKGIEAQIFPQMVGPDSPLQCGGHLQRGAVRDGCTQRPFDRGWHPWAGNDGLWAAGGL